MPDMNTEDVKHELPRNGGWGYRRRFITGANVLVSLVLAVVATILVNYLAARHFRYRCDVSRKQFYSLSEKTRHILSTVSGTLTAHIVFGVTSREKEETVRDIMRLLEAYRQFARRNGSLNLVIERVDPARDLATIETLKRKFDLRSADVVLFDSGAHSRCVAERDIVKTESRWATPGTGLRTIKTAFCGEREFSSAILSLMEARRPVACFVQGHGEREVDDFTKGSGYSDIARALRFENFEIRTTRLTDEPGIPADCDLLVIAGPRRVMYKSEIAALSAYLKSNRSLLCLLDAGQTTGLEPLMAEWAISLPDEMVTDKSSGLSALLGPGEELYIHNFGSHPLTENLTVMAMSLPRPVLPLEPVGPGANGRDDKPRVSVLASCSEKGWSDADYSTTPRFDPAMDRKGPVPLALAVERGPAGGVKVALKSTRIVVAGDSDFVANGRIAGANEDFFINAANWLVERDTLVAVGPKSYEQATLLMNEIQIWQVFMLVTVAIPGAVALFGIAIWFRRIW